MELHNPCHSGHNDASQNKGGRKDEIPVSGLSLLFCCVMCVLTLMLLTSL